MLCYYEQMYDIPEEQEDEEESTPDEGAPDTAPVQAIPSINTLERYTTISWFHTQAHKLRSVLRNLQAIFFPPFCNCTSFSCLPLTVMMSILILYTMLQLWERNRECCNTSSTGTEWTRQMNTAELH